MTIPADVVDPQDWLRCQSIIQEICRKDPLFDIHTATVTPYPGAYTFEVKGQGVQAQVSCERHTFNKTETKIIDCQKCQLCDNHYTVKKIKQDPFECTLCQSILRKASAADKRRIDDYIIMLMDDNISEDLRKGVEKNLLKFKRAIVQAKMSGMAHDGPSVKS